MPHAIENRLAREASPYLQQHAKNPVDWYPWGPEALERARREDRPILLSIGYSACHWCHVMDRESFEDEAIAGLMNAWFVNVKVDREERPDLDHVYQLVVQLLGRSGGWPLTVFLTPDQRPFFGGTYFPPEDRHGVPGFPKVLRALADAYRERREDVAAQATELAEAITKVTTDDAAPADATLLNAAPGPVAARAAEQLGARFDDRHGGFGGRPKFPNTMALELLLRRGVQDGDVAARARVATALDAMRAGGIHDHLGGGFHRYSTDEAWLVPHFEKMLYDNALLLRLYVDAARALDVDRYLETARSVVAYVTREMVDARGGFYAAQDADSEGEEGKSFVWSPGAIRAELAEAPEAARVALAHFDVTEHGNFESTGKSVLATPRELDEVAKELGLAPERAAALLEQARRTLFAARARREEPFRDEKVIASWNGLMIGAVAEYAMATGDAGALATASRAFAFLRGALVTPEGRVQRHAKDGVVKGPGFLDDHAYVANAALDLYEATGDPTHAAIARRIADAILASFLDPDGGFFFTPADGEALLCRTKDAYDQAVPNAQAMASLALLRLAALAEPAYAEPAKACLARIAPAARANPLGMAQTLSVLDRWLRGTTDVVLVGRRDDPRLAALAREIFRVYLPHRNVAWLDPHDDASKVACAALAEGKSAPGDAPVSYVCHGQACSLPVEDPEALRALLVRASR